MTPQKLYSLTDTIIARAFYSLFFLVPLIFTPFNFELFEFNKMLFTYAVSLIIVSAWATKSILAGKFIFRHTPLDIPLLLFLSSQLLSTFYSLDPHTSIWGYYSRSNGGLLSVISYLLLYWAYVSNMNFEKIQKAIKYLLSAGIIISIWGIFEHFGKSPSCLILRSNFDTSCWVQDVRERVFATLGQPNWMAAYLAALMPLAWAATISNIKKQKVKWLAISVLFFTALLFTNSRSGLLGFTVAYGIFWSVSFLHLNKHTLRPFFLLITSYLLLVAVFGTPWTHTSLERRTKNTTINAGGGTVLETGGTESGEIRKIVWKGALNIWKAYPVFGSGVETFAYSYYQFRPVEHNLTSEWDFLYNKAHNEYLNFLATTGVVGLGTYLLLVTAVIYGFLKSFQLPVPSFQSSFNLKINKLENSLEIGNWKLIILALASGWASILVTNFFGFSVVATSTLFFLFPAMAVVLTTSMKEEEIRSKSGKLILNNYYLIIPSLLLTFYLLFQILQIWQADTLYEKATELNNNGESLSAIKAAEKAVSLRPDEPVYYNELAKSLGGLAVSLSETGEASQAASLAESAIKAQDRAVTISPLNLNFLKARSALFFDLASVDPKYLEDAVLTLEKGVEIAPTEPKILYNLGVLYDRLGKTREASAVLKKALEIKPNYEDAKVALREIDKKLLK